MLCAQRCYMIVCIPLPTPCTLHPAPYTLHPNPGYRGTAQRWYISRAHRVRLVRPLGQKRKKTERNTGKKNRKEKKEPKKKEKANRTKKKEKEKRLTVSASMRRSGMTPGRPRISLIMALCLAMKPSTSMRASSVCQRHVVPTGFWWCTCTH